MCMPVPTCGGDRLSVGYTEDRKGGRAFVALRRSPIEANVKGEGHNWDSIVRFRELLCMEPPIDGTISGLQRFRTKGPPAT
jgi:hypothetical protein